MPAEIPIYIVTDQRGRQIDASTILIQLQKIEHLGDWLHPETQCWIDELGGKLISATGNPAAPAALVARLDGYFPNPFRAHLKASWKRLSAQCR